MPATDHQATWKAFHEAVNQSPARLANHLDTPESQAVGWKGEDGHGDGRDDVESVGHAMGRRIVDLLRRKRADLRDDDYGHMAKVVSYVHRHLAQRPDGDVTDTRWRYSLMNWGHDPLKDDVAR